MKARVYRLLARTAVFVDVKEFYTVREICEDFYL